MFPTHLVPNTYLNQQRHLFLLHQNAEAPGRKHSEPKHQCSPFKMGTCSGFSPGGTQAYSSKAQPESSSDVEFLWKSNMSLLMVFSISSGITVTMCSSWGHLQCRQIFLRTTDMAGKKEEKRNHFFKSLPGTSALDSKP